MFNTCADVFKPILLQTLILIILQIEPRRIADIQFKRPRCGSLMFLLWWNYTGSSPFQSCSSRCAAQWSSLTEDEDRWHSLRDLLDELAFLNIKLLSTCLSVSGNLLFQKWPYPNGSGRYDISLKLKSSKVTTSFALLPWSIGLSYVY